jgi:SAM-dependent methyltransferase
VTAPFDPQADHYEEELARGLSATGESRAHFAARRVAWLRDRLAARGADPRAVMDFGCGNGASTALLLDLGPQVGEVIGVDVSPRSLEIARARHGGERVRFELLTEHAGDARIDVAYTNGVFHHIPEDQRGEALAFVRRALKPGGLFGLYENNPWNPGTRWVMSRIPFDRDARPLTHGATERLLADAGFEVLSTDFLFIFPRSLSALRVLEPWVARWPLGGQYLVLARKPE